MHKDNTAQAKQKKDEREEVLKEIRSLRTARRFWRTSSAMRNARPAPAA